MSPLIYKVEPQKSADRHHLPAPFVVGASRSGTTLLRMMLDTHPDLAIPTETHFLPEIVRSCRDRSNPRECFLQAIISHRRWPDFHLDTVTFRRRIESLESFALADGFRMFYGMYAERFGKSRWGDKTPPYSAKMKLIHRLLPEVRFVHVIRDGRDVALSILDMRFGPNSVEEAAEWWVTRIGKARRHTDSLPYYMEVRYEDLILDSEATLRRICNFIELPWESTMLSYHETADERLAELDTEHVSEDGTRIIGVEERRSIHAMTRMPPKSSRVERWRKEMDRADRESFARIAGQTLQEFGYDVD